MKPIRLPEFATQHGLSIARIREAVATYAPHRFAFPWNGLEELLHANQEIALIGYGSLMHPVSAARTVQNTPPQGHEPVVAFGARRLYNYRMPDAVFAKYGVADPRARAALNLRPTQDAEDLFNGRWIPLAVQDLEGLRVRERGYDLEPVAVLRWNALPADAPRMALALSCPEGTEFVDGTLRPCPPYHQLCLEGARLVSDPFADLFEATTYQGDGARLVEDFHF